MLSLGPCGWITYEEKEGIGKKRNREEGKGRVNRGKKKEKGGLIGLMGVNEYWLWYDGEYDVW